MTADESDYPESQDPKLPEYITSTPGEPSSSGSSSQYQGPDEPGFNELEHSEKTGWKSKLGGLTKTISEKLPRNLSQNLNKQALLKSIQNFDPQTYIDWASRTFQKRNTSFYGTLLTITISTYFSADVIALILGEYIPEPLSSKSSRLGGNNNRSKTMTDYQPIFTRNLFNSQGLIPGDDITPSGTQDMGGVPIRSTLPLNLVGTLILENETKSIATIEDKGASAVYPVRVDDEIPKKIKIVKIEPRRVIFVNLSSGRREYLELPEEANKTNPIITAGRSSGPGIEKVAPTQFNVSRSEVDKALADFNNILTQARAVPNFENGVASGYKLFQIVPGSIYDKLGLQNGDVISGLNGQPINDPGKAFEMLSELKTSNHLELQVKKEGKSASTYTYDIH